MLELLELANVRLQTCMPNESVTAKSSHHTVLVANGGRMFHAVGTLESVRRSKLGGNTVGTGQAGWSSSTSVLSCSLCTVPVDTKRSCRKRLQ